MFWLTVLQGKNEAQTLPLHVNILKIVQVLFLSFCLSVATVRVLCVCRIELCAAGLFLYAFRCFLIVFVYLC